MNILHCESFYQFCDYAYLDQGPTQQDLPSGIINCDIQAIPNLFEDIGYHTEKEYIVVSSRSDYGLVYQNEHPPYKDLGKWMTLMEKPNIGYQDAKVYARVDKDKCDQNHKYSIKCYSHTSHTFNEIPNNVIKWYQTNLGIIDDERLINLPFGVNVTSGNKSGLDAIVNHPNNLIRDKLVYLNCSMNTVERKKLYEFYQNYDFITCKSEVPNTEYLDDLASHKFVLAPPGNGYDTYRVYESLTLGAIPILEMNENSYHLKKLNLPLVFCDNLLTLNPANLEAIWDYYHGVWEKLDWSFLTEEYWRKIIKNDKV